MFYIGIAALVMAVAIAMAFEAKFTMGEIADHRKY